jgi:hypothetical protein
METVGLKLLTAAVLDLIRTLKEDNYTHTISFSYTNEDNKVLQLWIVAMEDYLNDSLFIKYTLNVSYKDSRVYITVQKCSKKSPRLSATQLQKWIQNRGTVPLGTDLQMPEAYWEQKRQIPDLLWAL